MTKHKENVDKLITEIIINEDERDLFIFEKWEELENEMTNVSNKQ